MFGSMKKTLVDRASRDYHFPVPENYGSRFIIKPGDFAAVGVRGPLGWSLSLAELLYLETDVQFDHALIYVGDGMCVEAMPWGVSLDPMDMPLHEVYYNWAWSSGVLFPSDEQRRVMVRDAMGYVGTPYNYIEFLEAPAYAYDLWPMKQLWPAIMADKIMMCSQTVAQVWMNAGYPLCGGIWPGYVTPADLGREVLNNASH